MNANQTLSRLRDAIETRLQERLEQIREVEEMRKAEAEANARSALEVRLQKQREQYERAIGSECERALRKASEVEQTRLWTFEQEQMGVIEQTIRERLATCGPEKADFEAWLSSAITKLKGSGDNYLLKVNERWCNELGAMPFKVRTQPLLGGAILTDTVSGRQVDGSWDRRLAETKPEIRERWQKDVSTDYQDQRSASGL